MKPMRLLFLILQLVTMIARPGRVSGFALRSRRQAIHQPVRIFAYHYNDDKRSKPVKAGNIWPSSLRPMEKWGPVAAQWTIYAGIVVGTSAVIMAAGPALGLSADAALSAAEAFPLVVGGTTVLNLVLNNALGSGQRLATGMGGEVSTDVWVNTMVGELHHSMGLKGGTPVVYVIPSDEPNAFAAGTGDEQVVALTEGILELLDANELRAVVAHELGHLLHRDVSRAMQTAAMLAGLSGAMQLGDYFMKSARFSQFLGRRSNEDQKRSSAGAAIGLVLYVAGISTFASGTLLRLASSRKAEFAADDVSAEALGSGWYLAEALKKLEMTHGTVRRNRLAWRRGAFSHLYIDNPPNRQPLESLWGLLRTHPTTQERVGRLLNREIRNA